MTTETEDYSKAAEPTAHKSTHQNGGDDKISVAGLSGVLADEQNAGAIKGKSVDDTDIGDQKVLAYDSGSDSIIYISQAAAGAAIKSIQPGVITISDTNISNDATITEVDPNKSIVISQNWTGDLRSNMYWASTIRLIDGTTVRATRGAGLAGYNASHGFCVIEFESGLIGDVQRGVRLMDGTGSADITITELTNVNNAVVIPGGFWHATHSDSCPAEIFPRWQIIDTTTLRALWRSGTTGARAAWQIIEFDI